MANFQLGTIWPSPGLRDARTYDVNPIVDVVTPPTAQGMGLSRFVQSRGGWNPLALILGVRNTLLPVDRSKDVAAADRSLVRG